MVAAQPGRVCLIPVAYGSSTAWSCVVAYKATGCLLDSCVLDPLAYGQQFPFENRTYIN